MMTTNFLISVAAISSLMLSIYNQLRAPVATPVARPVLQRSDATLEHKVSPDSVPAEWREVDK